jgi:hypothetical protein
MPAASSIQRIERNNDAPTASAASGSLGNSRFDGGTVRAQCVETPHQEIEHPVARALVGLAVERLR